MPDDTLKKLLVRLNLDTSSFKGQIQTIKSELKSMNEQAKQDAVAITAESKKNSLIIKEQIDDQKRLQAEARTLLAVDQAKAQWQKTQQEAINTKIKSAALETAEIRKQGAEKLKQISLEKQSLALAKEQLKIKQQEVNLFNVGKLKAQVKFEPFKAPTVGVQPQEQTVQLNAEKTRLLMLDKQVQALELQGKYRKVDAEYVRSAIGSERALAEAAEAGVKNELTRLRLLKQQASITAEHAIPANVAALRSQAEASAMPRTAPVATTGTTTQLRQMTVPEIMQELRLINQASASMGPTGTGSTTPVGVHGMPVTQMESLSQQRALVNEARTKLTIEEQTLKLLSTQDGIRKADVIEVQKGVAEQRLELAVMESQLKVQEQLVLRAREQAQLQSRIVNPSAVMQLKQRVGMGAGMEAPSLGGLTGVGGMFGPSAGSVLAETAEERKKLAIQEAELKVLAQQGEFRKIDVNEALKSVTAERQKLTLLEMQVKEQKEQSLTGRITSKIGESTGALGGIMQRMFGGGLLGGVAGGMFTGFVGAELFSGLIENVHRLGEALVEETGVSRQMRQEFERLANMHGIAPDQMIDDLRKSTRGLVADTDLFKMANNVLRSGMKVTNDQIMSLISNTLNLGRSMGKSSSDTTRALELAFLNPQRGMMTLARQTGIQVQVLRQAISGLPATLDPTVKATIMFNHILAEEEKMLKRVGVPVTTMPELFLQLRTAQRNFIDDMAQGALGTNSLEASIQKLSKWLIDHKKDLEEWANKVGRGLSDAIQWTIDHAGALTRTLEVLIGLKMLKFVSDLTGGFAGWGKAIGFVVDQIKGLQLLETLGLGKKVGETVATGTVLSEGAEVAGGAAAATVGAAALALSAAAIAGYLLSQYSSQIWSWVTNAIRMKLGMAPDLTPSGLAPGQAPAYSKGRFTQAEDVTGRTVKVDKTPGQDVTNMMEFLGPGDSGDGANANMALSRKLADQRKQIEMELNQLHIEQVKQRVEQEEDLVKNQYDEGLISLRSYVAQESALKTQEFDAEMNRIQKDKEAQLAAIKARTTATIDGVAYDVENAEVAANLTTMVLEKSKIKETDLITKHNKDMYTLQRQQMEDEQSAYRSYQEELGKIVKEGVDDRRSILETEFKEGFVGADDYIAQRKTLIKEELDATLAGLALQKSAAKITEEEKAKIFIQEVEARRKADTDMMQLDLHKDDIALQSLQTHFEKASKYLQLESTIAKSGRVGSEAQDQYAISSMLLGMTTEYISELEKQRAPLQQGSEAWMNITDHIAQATEQQQKLNLELIQARDISQPLSSIFGSLAGIFNQFRGTGAKAVGETLGTMSGSLEKISSFSTFIAQQRSPKAPLDLAAVQKTAAQMFSERLADSASKLGVHANALEDDIIALKEHRDALSAIALGENEVPSRGAENNPNPFDFLKGLSFVGDDGTSYVARPSFAIGGIVPGVGPIPITAHGQESIFPPGVIQQFVAGLKSAIDALQQFASKAKSAMTGPPTKPIPTNMSLTGPGGVNSDAVPLPIPGLGGTASDVGNAASQKTSTTDPFQQLTSPITNLAHSFMSLFNSSTKASDGTTTFGSKMHDFAGQMTGWMQGISGLVQGLTSGKTGGQGALSGGMAGMQFGSSFGPIGSIAGLVGGGIMGGIFGSKEKQLQQSIHQIQDSMQSIVDSMNEGAITLNQAIVDLRNERQQAIQTLSGNPKGGKGGGKGGKKGFQPSQAQAVIDQIDSQIAQLVQTQTQLLSQLDQQVAVLANPQPFQQYVSSLNQIIQQYQQYMSAAAGSTQAMGNAQTFLNESLQTYVTTLSQQLNQAQQTAIQDSLTLLNLEYQRQQVINQEAQQEYDILTQGVLTRQRTTAMTKGQQIGQIQYQANMQLTQIDEQIALAQYQVQTAQQIFDLATTRIGLETQLLSLQEGQADQQNQQTAALLQVVQALQGGMANGSIMSSLTSLGGSPTGTGLLTTIMGDLGLGGNVPSGILTGQGGATNYLNQIPQQYQSITNFINNLDPNFLQNLWSAMQQPAGSAQRQAALAEAQPYASDANTSGFDFNSFAQWITSGAAITGTTASVTNTPTPTGPSGLPTGTTFGMPTTPGTAPSTIPGYTGNGSQTPFQSVSSGYDAETDQLTSTMSTLNSNTQSMTTGMTNLTSVMSTLSANIAALNAGIKSGYNGSGVAQSGAIPEAGGGGAPYIFQPNQYNFPRYATGGPVLQTGPAIVEQGEYVLPPTVVTLMNTVGGVQNFINSMLGSSDTGGPGGPGGYSTTSPLGMGGGGSGVGIDTGSAQIDVQSQLLDMTTARTTMEMNVVSARQQQILLESQYLQALNDTMTQIAQYSASNPGGPAGNVESQFTSLYQSRGRMGSGNFRGETL
jgi:hypothetical protein